MPPCELLGWDSRHFGRRIGRVLGHRLTREAMADVDRWAAQEAVECLYFLAGPGDPETAAIAEASGFRLVDIRVTLERRLEPDGPRDGLAAGPGGAAGTAPTPVRIRTAAAADLPDLRRIAAASHHDSRFYYDPHFDRRRCDDLYATWIEKSCADPAGTVLVAELPDRLPAGRAAGYITAAASAGGAGKIGLFAVDAAAQGHGAGGELIAAALAWLAGRGASLVTVVTQGRNVRAQRAYQRSGMLTRSVELWYHWWRAGKTPADGADGMREQPEIA